MANLVRLDANKIESDLGFSKTEQVVGNPFSEPRLYSGTLTSTITSIIARRAGKVVDGFDVTASNFIRLWWNAQLLGAAYLDLFIHPLAGDPKTDGTFVPKGRWYNFPPKVAIINSAGVAEVKPFPIRIDSDNLIGTLLIEAKYGAFDVQAASSTVTPTARVAVSVQGLLGRA